MIKNSKFYSDSNLKKTGKNCHDEVTTKNLFLSWQWNIFWKKKLFHCAFWNFFEFLESHCEATQMFAQFYTFQKCRKIVKKFKKYSAFFSLRIVWPFQNCKLLSNFQKFIITAPDCAVNSPLKIQFVKKPTV